MFIFNKKSVYLLLMLFSITLSAQVGIGTTTPAEELDVVGDIQFSGEIKPSGASGNTGQLLMSDGAGTPTIWGANLGNVSAITRYVTSPGLDVNANSTNSVTITVLGLTTSGSAIVNIQGNGTSDIYDDLTIHNVEIRTDEIRFSITNNTGKRIIVEANPKDIWVTQTVVNYPGMIFNVTVIR